MAYDPDGGRDQRRATSLDRSILATNQVINPGYAETIQQLP